VEISAATAYYYRKLYEVAATINSGVTANEVLSSIVESLTKAMKAKGCSIMLLTPAKKSLIHTISYGLSEAFIEAGPRSVETSIPEAASGKGQVAVIHDVAAEKQRFEHAERLLSEGIVSVLAVPMRLKGDMIGQVRVYTAEPRHFNDEDIYFVQAISNLGAIALDNARLYDSFRRAHEYLTSDFISFRWGRGGTMEGRRP